MKSIIYLSFTVTQINKTLDIFEDYFFTVLGEKILVNGQNVEEVGGIISDISQT